MKKLDQNLKEDIVACALPVRETAVMFKVSPTTVVKLRNMKTFDVPPKKAKNELPEHLRLLLAEMVRLSRYPQRQWIEFLGVLLPKLPTSLRLFQQETTKTAPLKVLWSKQKLYNELRQELGSEKRAKAWPPEERVLAVHRVKVEWSDNNEGKRVKADILCLMERFTGMVYFRAYNRLQPNGIRKSILRFLSFFPVIPSKLVFVGMPGQQKKSAKVEGQGKEKAAKKVKSPVSTATLDDLDSTRELIVEEFKKIDVDYSQIEMTVEDPLGSAGKRTILLPRSFDSLADLNQALINLANDYNCKKRASRERERSWRNSTPLERLWNVYRVTAGRNAIRRSDFNARTIIKKHANLQKGWY